MAKKQNEQSRNSFTFYASFEEAINEIEESDKETQLMLYRAICRYGLYHETPKLKGIANIVWRIIAPILDTQWTKFLNGCKGAEYGKLGGAPTGNKNASKTTPKTTPKQPLNNPQDKDKDKDKDKSSSFEMIDDDDFLNDFDLSGVPIEFVKSCFISVVKSHDIQNVKPYFAKWWETSKGKVIEAYNKHNALMEEKQMQADAERKREATKQNSISMEEAINAKNEWYRNMFDCPPDDVPHHLKQRCNALYMQWTFAEHNKSLDDKANIEQEAKQIKSELWN